MLDASVCCAAGDGRSYLYYWFLANKLPECYCLWFNIWHACNEWNEWKCGDL